MAKTYTVKQVATALGFSTNTVYKYLEEGKIKATRLGKEGRFKIPEKELVRLLGAKVDHQPIEENSVLADTHQQGPFGEELKALNKISNPDLFDWFLSLSAIFLGVAYFLFPYQFQQLVFEPFRNWVLILKIILFFSGLTLMVDEILFSTKKLHFHILGRIPMIISLVGLTYVYFTVEEFWTMTYFANLAIFSLISLFWNPKASLKFFLFVLCLTLSSGLIFARDPQPFFFVDLRSFIYYNPGIFETLLVLGTSLLVGLATVSYFKNQTLLVVFSYLIGIFFFIVALSFIGTQAWNRAVIALLIGSFSLILPFGREFEFSAQITRKDALISFFWMVVVIVIGVVLVYFVQQSFRGFILTESQRQVETASNMVSSFAEDGVKATQNFTQDKTLVTLLSSTGPNTTALNSLLKDFYLGTTTLRRVTVFNENGLSVAFYPTLAAEKLPIKIIDQPLFNKIKQSKQTMVSGGLVPLVENLPIAVYIGVPILDDKGNFKGMISGALDLSQLQDKLSTIMFGEDGAFVVADHNKIILIHKNKTLIGKEVQKNKRLIEATQGQSGQVEGYSEEGILSLQAYTSIKSLQWGIIAQQPYAAAFRTSSIISFSIFLMTMILGISTLIVVMHLRKRL